MKGPKCQPDCALGNYIEQASMSKDICFCEVQGLGWRAWRWFKWWSIGKLPHKCLNREICAAKPCKCCGFY